jgi:hypothetical protein
MATVSVLRAKIERVVRREFRYPDAEFFHLRNGGRWLCAQAWITDQGPKVAARAGSMNVEDAAIVSTALQMAIDWVVSEMGQ